MTIRSRLLITVVAATSGLVGISVMVQIGTARVDQRQNEAASAERVLRAFLAVELLSTDYLREASEQIVFGETAREDSSAGTVAEARRRVEHALDELERTVVEEREARSSESERLTDRRGVAVLRAGFRYLADAIAPITREPDGSDRLIAFHDALEAYEVPILWSIEQAVAEQQRRVDEASQSLAQVAQETRLFTFVLSGAVTAAVVLLLLIVARRVVAGVQDLKEATRRIAHGDLSAPFPRRGGRDELGQVAAAFAEMAGALRRRTEEVRESHDRVAAANRELAAANQQLAASLRKVQDAQAQLVQSGKMAAVGQLAGGLAHEINNPLGVILGFAQGIQRRLKEGDALAMPVGSIVREGLRCKALVQELLTFSRTARKNNEPCDINLLVGSALVLVETKARTLGIQVVTELAADLPFIDANSTQLQQVIVNLGTNALDAMAAGGVLTVRTRPGPAGGVVIEVVDTGSGIPPEVLERMFEPFFTTKEVGKGTGLGLSLVHEMVQQHGGAIAVDTEIGRGTTMCVRLPCQAARADKHRAVA